MAHIELPVAPNHHVTLVHFHKPLDRDQGQIALDGMNALAQVYGNHLTDMYWGFEIMVGPPGRQQKASGIEFGTDALPALQHRLKEGLKSRGLPVSEDFTGWLPHVTNPPVSLTPWSYLRHQGKLTLVQGQFRIDADFPPVPVLPSR